MKTTKKTTKRTARKGDQVMKIRDTRLYQTGKVIDVFLAADAGAPSWPATTCSATPSISPARSNNLRCLDPGLVAPRVPAPLERGKAWPAGMRP